MKEIVIKIPDDYNVNMGAEILIDAVIDGVELPKGHGRLIDADSLDIPVDICDGFEAMDYIYGADTIIEADKAESEVEE